MSKQIITLEDILKAAEAGKTSIPASPDGDIVTDQAREKADELGISLPGAPQSDGTASPAGDPLQGQVVEQVCTLIAEKVGNGMTPDDLRQVVGDVVAARLGGSVPAEQGGEGNYADAGGVYLVECARLFKTSPDSASAEGRAFVAEAVNCGCADLTGAYMEWENAAFPRTLETPEIAVVVEGELNLTSAGKTLVGRPGDMLYFSEGSQVEYAATSKVRLACISAK